MGAFFSFHNAAWSVARSPATAVQGDEGLIQNSCVKPGSRKMTLPEEKKKWQRQGRTNSKATQRHPQSAHSQPTTFYYHEYNNHYS